MKKFNIYKLISIIAFLLLIFILAVPQFFNIDKKKNAEECIKNMKIIYKGIERYMNEREINFEGTARDLMRTGYLKKTYECPGNGVGDKYFMSGDYESGQIIVKCSNKIKAQEENKKDFQDHELPESLIE